jgi:hypothetical protein
MVMSGVDLNNTMFSPHAMQRIGRSPYLPYSAPTRAAVRAAALQFALRLAHGQPLIAQLSGVFVYFSAGVAGR